ncbi:hypothetical protein UK23_29495 [Lentzea aerocolonigenes]|uniref:Uncharacterized protein n=1 Tax=Lentzea aerocolonigenes TaxID=68170 RepID=A0A0F0GR59_LENAE|nr:hypothetical protein [Lentzea aerocolonigenes]KJK44437.1 hypothetical protein UK23_29495 [Lentzea aerocolonigenes]
MGKGFFTRRKTYKLVWPEGEELAGLEARATATSLRKYMAITGIIDGEPPESFEDEDGTVYDFAANPDSQFEFIIKVFSTCLLDWNLTDEDEVPVPATEAGLWDQDREFVLILIRAWVDALGSISRPLAKPSVGGSSLAEELIPMESLSESLAS